MLTRSLQSSQIPLLCHSGCLLSSQWPAQTSTWALQHVSLQLHSYSGQIRKLALQAHSREQDRADAIIEKRYKKAKRWSKALPRISFKYWLSHDGTRGRNWFESTKAEKGKMLCLYHCLSLDRFIWMLCLEPITYWILHQPNSTLEIAWMTWRRMTSAYWISSFLYTRI